MDKQYEGMTVNERLYISGFMEAFDKAIKENNIVEITDILKKIEIADESAITAILKNLRLQCWGS
ncbi:MAG: hypothetical protein LBV44_01170 [Methylobacillus sp.]|jgi:hypothetical protein|nr:hypothetical protein [Methylobacillus sp.]